MDYPIPTEQTNGHLQLTTTRKISDIFEEGTAENTRKAYRKDLAYFFAWAEAESCYVPTNHPIPVEMVLKFITDHVTGLPSHVDKILVGRGIKAKLGSHRVTTITRRIAALSVFHKLRNLSPNPCTQPQITQLLSKTRSRAVKRGHRPAKKKAATLDLLTAMLATCDDSLSGLRTKAMLLFAFSSGGRRASEVSAATVEHLTPIGDDYTYLIEHSKTDQQGDGHTVPITGVAASALRAWLTTANITEGRLFRGVTRHGQLTDSLTPTSVSRIIKKHAARAGLDPGEFSSHSMRSGFVTEAGRQKHSLGDTMALSGHRSISVAMRYYHSGAAINNPAARLL